MPGKESERKGLCRSKASDIEVLSSVSSQARTELNMCRARTHETFSESLLLVENETEILDILEVKRLLESMPAKMEIAQ